LRSPGYAATATTEKFGAKVSLSVDFHTDLTWLFVRQVTRIISNHPLGYTAKFPSEGGLVWNEKTSQLSVKINKYGSLTNNYA
jgi:hypothetical protein